MSHALAITWLGHSAFILRLPSGQRIVTDPWLSGPTCPAAFRRPESLGPIDLILLSHGHADHADDVVAVSRATGAPVVCLVELADHLERKGLQAILEMNIGGTQVIGGLTITMTMALHTGSIEQHGHVRYAGGAAGFIIRAPQTPTMYFAGDTGIFGDMKILGEIYRPEIAFLPIGDRYTMGPDTAALAARWLGVRQVVPMHWGTFPVLTGTPDALRVNLGAADIDVLDLTPGETTV